MSVDVNRLEFLCPLCKSLSNTVIAHVPPIAHASALAAAATSATTAADKTTSNNSPMNSSFSPSSIDTREVTTSPVGTVSATIPTNSGSGHSHGYNIRHTMIGTSTTGRGGGSGSGSGGSGYMKGAQDREEVVVGLAMTREARVNERGVVEKLATADGLAEWVLLEENGGAGVRASSLGGWNGDDAVMGRGRGAGNNPVEMDEEEEAVGTVKEKGKGRGKKTEDKRSIRVSWCFSRWTLFIY